MQTPLSWDDLRTFLAIARAGSFTGAAKALDVDHTTIARRLSALEGAAGLPLFDRSPRGVSLTGHGRILVDHAERMEIEANLAAAALGAHSAVVEGIVRLATPEAFGSFLLAPNIHRLTERHPRLEIELVPESRLVNLVNREADIAIALDRPSHGRLITRRLADYRVGLYASRRFLAGFGPVTDAAQIRDQPFVEYIDSLIDMPELRYLKELASEARSVFRSSSSIAQHSAVANGLGFGMLHIFAAEEDERLERVLPAMEARRSYWLALHADHQRAPRIRAVVDFIDEIIAENRARF